MGDQVSGDGASPKDNKLVTMMKRLSSLVAIKSRARANSNHELAAPPDTHVDLEAQRHADSSDAEQSQSPTPSDIQNERGKYDGKIRKCLLSCCGWNKERGEWSPGRFWSIVLAFGLGFAVVLLIMAVVYYIVRKSRR